MKREDYIACITRMLEILDETELDSSLIYARCANVGYFHED